MRGLPEGSTVGAEEGSRGDPEGGPMGAPPEGCSTGYLEGGPEEGLEEGVCQDPPVSPEAAVAVGWRRPGPDLVCFLVPCTLFLYISWFTRKLRVGDSIWVWEMS